MSKALACSDARVPDGFQVFSSDRDTSVSLATVTIISDALKPLSNRIEADQR